MRNATSDMVCNVAMNMQNSSYISCTRSMAPAQNHLRANADSNDMCRVRSACSSLYWADGS